MPAPIEPIDFARPGTHSAVVAETPVRWLTQGLRVISFLAIASMILFVLTEFGHPWRLRNMGLPFLIDILPVLAWSTVLICPATYVQRRAYRSRKKSTGFLAVVLVTLAASFTTLITFGLLAGDINSGNGQPIVTILSALSLIALGTFLLATAIATARWSASLPRPTSKPHNP